MTEMKEQKGRHFLFYIFKADKEENPMPQNKAESLLYYLKNIFTENSNNHKGRK